MQKLPKVYFVLLAGHPELGVQAAFTDAGRARAFAAASDLRAFVDETDLHGRNCCEPHPLVTVSQG
jgi:hypothetical protein